ncbi:hypothetical protein [Actinoplanes sp. NPDC049265]|uniref:hypothetical protein n=1 Tax=Actinoplanes sp. NPDC049265 TaxID=3363902 RepID=UPI00370FC2B0
MPRESAAATLAALLDRSIARVGELAADGRCFDRGEVVRACDVWDNNTGPFFRVACSPWWARERRGRQALCWLADFGDRRRDWVAGLVGDRLLPPARPDPPFHRDRRGVVQPAWDVLTATALDYLTRDYDLAGAEVTGIHVERAGAAITGRVTLTARRLFDAPEATVPAVVRLMLGDIRTVRLDSADATGAAADLGAGGVTIRAGSRGVLAGADATFIVEDDQWHLSSGGRAADARAADLVRGDRRPLDRPALGVPASNASFVLHRAMLLIRSVRYAKLVGRAPLRELSAGLKGAGEAILSAAHSDRALQRLHDGWLEACPQLARELHRQLPDNAAFRAVPVGDPPPDPAPANHGQLTLASFGRGGATVNFATGDDWELRSAELPGAERIVLDTAAFTEPHPISYDAFAMGDDVLTIR